MSNEFWLRDQLYELLGVDDKITHDYIKSVAMKCTTPQELNLKLQSIHLSVSDQFCEAVLDRFVGIKPYKPSDYEVWLKEKEMEKLKEEAEYEFIKEDPIEKKIKINHNPNENKEQDKAEMQEFHERMIQKKNTKKDSKYAEIEKEIQLQQVKEKSRQAYLEKREKVQLELKKRQLDDDKQLFDDSELTTKEKMVRHLNQEIYNTAAQQKDLEIAVDYYVQPTAFEDDQGKIDIKKKNEVLNKVYKDVGPIVSEDKEWEQFQSKRATQNVRTQDDLEKKRQKQYEYVFANQIDFIKNDFIQEMKQKKNKNKNKDTPSTIQQPVKSAMQIIKESLPIFQYRKELLTLIRDNRVIVMVGETGSGKTTQLPQYLHEIGYTVNGKVGCTQPRRVAAMSVASRVALEMGVKLGQEVGYSIRFEDCCSDRTVIKYMTDGMLLREFLLDPTLNSYKVLIIDEAHERTLHTDILLALIKDLSRAREDLKVIISSATLDALKFSEYFDDAPIIQIPGRRYQVDIYYTQQPEANYVEAAIVTVLQIHVSQGPGDILVFLTGQEEIEEAQEMIQNRIKGFSNKIPELIICPVYAALPSEQQIKIFEKTPNGCRKVVLATNIAETSITIDNIIFVVDCGFVKQTTFSPKTGMESLQVVACSKANANQRAGRAGRVAPGKCFRLFTLWSYNNELEDSPIPEIQRTNLGNVVLLLKTMGITNLVNFDYMDPPPHEMLLRALEQLYSLGALNDGGELTKMGRRMAEFPLDPLLSKTLISSEHFKCVDQITTICAMLSVGNTVFYRPKEKQVHADTAKKNFYRPGGDHLCLLNVYNQWRDQGFSREFCLENFIQLKSMKRARDIKEQLQNLCSRVEIDITNEELSIYEDGSVNIRKCITAGFFYNSAKLQKNGLYKTLKNSHETQIHPSSLVFQEKPEWVIYHELVLTTKEYMRIVCEIKPEWLFEIAPHYFSEDFIKSNQKSMPKLNRPDLNSF